MTRLNVNGRDRDGSSLGATGAMLLGTALDELERTGKTTALITLCMERGWARDDHRTRIALAMVLTAKQATMGRCESALIYATGSIDGV